MNHKYLRIYFFFALLIPLFYLSSSGGRNDNRAGAPTDQSTCGLCHSGSGNGTVNVAGVPSNYQPGVTYPFSLTVGESGASALTQSVAGFQIVASNGINGLMQGAFVTGPGSRINSTNRLVQDAPLAYDMNDEATWDFSWTAPLNGPDEIIFYYAANSADDNGTSSGDITYFNATSSIILPVVWSYIELEEVGNSHVISWGTESEENSDYYIVEMSKDGVHYDALYREAAKGFSHVLQHYEFIYEPLNAGEIYYRIKQVDIDGKYTFSSIVQGDFAGKLKIYPTFFNDEIRISGNRQPINLELFDVQGKRVLIARDQSTLNTYVLPQGSYFLNVLNEYGQLLGQSKMIKI